MKHTAEPEKEKHLRLVLELEEKKHEYKIKWRPMGWFRNILIIDISILVLACIAETFWGNNPDVDSWCTFFFWVFGILLAILIIYFFDLFYYLYLMVDNYSDERLGFRGIKRIKELIEAHDEIAGIETNLRILEQHQAHWLTPEEQYILYKDNLLDVISEYQRKANRNRRTYFILQIIIIACSLFVSGLTSGLTSLISIFGNHWIAPAASFTVSFLTAMVTLFRPREKGYNLQQTSDAIQYEIACANRRIFGYNGLSDREAYTRLAEEVEKLRNEQRKRQQQLEQASEGKQQTEQ